jgi:hypothetical protein
MGIVMQLRMRADAMPPVTEAETFKRRLSEVIAWCTPRVSIADPEHCLRTPALQPPDLLQASRSVTNQLNERVARELAQAPGEPLPKLAERRGQEFARLYRVQMPGIQAEQQAAVDALAEERARLLQLAKAYPDPDERDVLVRDLSGGRLLVCTGLDESVWDGAAQAESRGFFDINDLAPWDTWICYVRPQGEDNGRTGQAPFVMSWVPSAFVRLVEDGIRVNPVGCIRWLEKDTLASPIT